VSEGQDVRQRASICQDCWFWKEMSCALASPTDGVCANKRPVQGRRAARPEAPTQPQLTPLAAGHAAGTFEPTPAPAPFPADAPESTFTMSQLRAPEQPRLRAIDAPVVDTPAATRTSPPSLREIRSGRAVAASRAPVAQVRIPVHEHESGTLLSDAAAHAPAVNAVALAGMDQLVERVRQRTAARLSSRAAANRLA
jgi:hypothetical protein